jgi:hypothetical protein
MRAAAAGWAARVVGGRRARCAVFLLGRPWCVGGGVGVAMLRGWEDAGLVGNRARIPESCVVTTTMLMLARGWYGLTDVGLTCVALE